MRLNCSLAMLWIAAGVVAAEEPAPKLGEYIVTPGTKIPLGLLNSVVGAYYYLRVLVYMYMREPAAGAPVAIPMRSGYVAAALLVSAAGSVPSSRRS